MTIQDAHAHALQTLADALNLSRAEANLRARLLLDWTTNLRHAHLIAPLQTLADSEIAQFYSALQQAKQGRPIPYILGAREFCGLPFRVDESVLIPREETEMLVETVCKYLQDVPHPQIGDLGTGSGCIAISLAHARPDAQIIATDIAADSLALARQNARDLKIENVEFRHSDGTSWAAPLQNLPASTCATTFDAIVSNPPYIARAEIETLQIEVREWEPRRALDGGNDGLDAYRALAAQVGGVLKTSGFVALELGAEQFEDVRAIFGAQQWQVETPINDLAGHARVLVARKNEFHGDKNVDSE